MKRCISKILKAHQPQAWSEEHVIPAAVLIPLLVKNGELHVLLTVRTDKVETHKGQVSFPGGVHEDGDKNMLATALRETSEEVGINPDDIDVLGELDQLISVTDFIITPYVGIIPHPYQYNHSRKEIAELLEVPLSFFLDEKNRRSEQHEFRGRAITVYFFDYGKHLIWGVTARILMGFLDLLRRSEGSLPDGFPRVSCR
ncbi:MAG: CoA pyrophosphatase [candidate division Zixibacteria bacterium]|nr:CoA pyrophosphatase [candidate division Zixibacteria bacterium]